MGWSLQTCGRGQVLRLGLTGYRLSILLTRRRDCWYAAVIRNGALCCRMHGQDAATMAEALRLALGSDADRVQDPWSKWHRGKDR